MQECPVCWLSTARTSQHRAYYLLAGRTQSCSLCHRESIQNSLHSSFMDTMKTTPQTSAPGQNASVNAETSYYKKYAHSLWITKGCRFEASRRLAKKEHNSLFTISILSIYVIAGTLLPVFKANDASQMYTLMPFATVLTSIFIIVLTHLEAGKRYLIRSERMHRCGQELNDIYYELELL